MNTHKILVGICSHYGGRRRREVIRKTWLGYDYPKDQIKCFFFIGGDVVPEDGRDDTIALGSNDRYDYLPRKCLDFYRWAYEHHDFDYIFKCDDDTFLALDRLSGVIDDDYGLIGDPSTIKPGRMAPSGGAGYFLSRELVKSILEYGKTPDRGCEDLIFGKAALILGARCKSDERLCMHAGKPPLPGNDMVSCHWCSVEQMRFYDRLYGCDEEPVLTIAAKHQFWDDTLSLYRGGILRRDSGGDMARLENHGNGMLSVNWVQWPREMVRKRSDTEYSSNMLKLTVTPSFNLEDFVRKDSDVI